MILIDGVRSVVLLGGDTVSGQRKLRRWAAVAALAVTAAAVVYAGGDEAAAAVPPAEVIAVAPTDSAATIVRNAGSVVPSPRQLAWQRLEHTAFVHFGVDTYTGTQLGTGTENPNIFQPTSLNTDQWVSALKGAGFTEAILTVKHHDGFMLYPSRYTTFDVASSSWLGGTGDVVRNFTTSAHNAGMKVGLYVSPADLHEALAGGRYANGSAR